MLWFPGVWHIIFWQIATFKANPLPPFQLRPFCPHTLLPTAQCENIFSLKAVAVKFYKSSVPTYRAKSMTERPYARKWRLLCQSNILVFTGPTTKCVKTISPKNLLSISLRKFGTQRQDHLLVLVPLVPTCQTDSKVVVSKVPYTPQVITPTPCHSPTWLQDGVKIILNPKYGGSLFGVVCTYSLQHPLHANVTTN